MRAILVGKFRTKPGVSTEVWEKYGLEQNGVDTVTVDLLYKGPDSLRQRIAAAGQADYIFYYSTHGVDADVIRDTKHIARRSALITFDAISYHGTHKADLFLSCADAVDYVFHTGGAPECSRAIRVPQGCEPMLDLVVPSERLFGAPVHVGHINKTRASWSDEIKRHGVELFGYNGKTYAYRQDLLNLCFERSVVVANVRPVTDGKVYYVPGYWSNRIYVITGFGGCILHPNVPGIEKEFEPDKEVVLYDSYDEMYDKLKWLMDDHAFTGSVGSAAMVRSRADHTYTNRARRILDIIGG